MRYFTFFDMWSFCETVIINLFYYQLTTDHQNNLCTRIESCAERVTGSRFTSYRAIFLFRMDTASA